MTFMERKSGVNGSSTILACCSSAPDKFQALCDKGVENLHVPLYVQQEMACDDTVRSGIKFA